MAQDNGPSRIADVAERLDVSRNYANQYRSRLLDSELIASAGHGRLALNLPGLRHHLRSVVRERDLEDGFEIEGGVDS